MIERIIEGALRNRGLVIVLYVLVIGWGVWAVRNTPVDAIPNIGENQVIVFADWPGRSPQDVEDQVIYPLTINLMGLPRVKVVRSNSYFGFGLANVIFEDGVDFYWARTRILERLDQAQQMLPEGVSAVLGPDATALGQVFWYTVENGYYCEDHPNVSYEAPGECPEDGNPLVRSNLDLGELRSLHDWYVRYQLNAVAGVAEVASVGGFVKQYQIDVHPDRLLALGIRLSEMMMAVKRSNLDVGAKVFEEGGVEFVVRGVGFIKTPADIEDIVIGAHEGVPVYVKNVADVTIGPDFRRGALDKEGVEVTGGVVLMQFGENPLRVIDAVKAKVKELEQGLPPGVRIAPFYDRTQLIHRSINTLTVALLLATAITILTIVVFLRHVLGSFIISLVLPVGVLIAFVVMKYIGVDANIMSLGGIIIAIGVMVDSGIVMTENAYQRLAEARAGKEGALTSGERLEVCVAAATEVGKPVLFALLTTIVSFIPVFALSGKSGRLFHPLAFTKTFTMGGAALITLTLLPTLSYYLLRGRLRSVDETGLSRLLRRAYRPVLTWALNHKVVPVVGSALILAVGLVTLPAVKREFMPPLDEGDLLFMPVLLPGASLTQVMDVMRKQDMIIKNEFPDEVEMVVGKLGRAETATDPAPVTMIETIIRLTDKKHWRKGMTRDRLIGEIVEATRIPGVSPIMTQPIQNRIDMLATGIQTPVGVKVFGDSLSKLVEIAVQIERLLSDMPGAVGPYAERADKRPYLEIEIDRRQAARYGVRVGDVQDVVMTAIGGMNLSTTVEGRERYPIRVRYPRELRDNVEALKRVLVPTPSGAQIPLSQVATLKKVSGPVMVGTENALPYARVFVNVDQSRIGLVDFVDKARDVVQRAVVDQGKLPPGYYIAWSGQYESELEARKRIVVAVPVALVAILLLLYMVFKNVTSAAVVASALPISLMGGVMLLFVLGFKMSVAVWVGFIALFGVATDNAVVLVSTLDGLFRRRAATSVAEVRETTVEGGLRRVRPSLMTTMTTILALIPVMASSGTGSEVMKPMVSPTIGGLVTATVSNLLLVPVVYAWLRERALRKAHNGGEAS
jgi:Cu(I)/Ag(I) efflux system membrane protein CusA/SilA